MWRLVYKNLCYSLRIKYFKAKNREKNMFKFLKEKLQRWTKKLSSEAPEIKEEPRVPKREEKKKPVEKVKKQAPQKKVDKNGDSRKKDLNPPMEFNAAIGGYQPNLEKLEQIEHEIEDEDEEENASQGSSGFFSKLKEKFSGKTRISEEEFNVYAEDLQLVLLENNVAFEVAEKIISELREKILNRVFTKKEIESEIKSALKQSIQDILIEPFNVLERIKYKSLEKGKEPYVILFAGINGTGKTTTIAKIGSWLSKNDVSCVIAAGDTFRAASIEQIKIHGEALGLKVISQQYGADPASVGFDAISYAKKSGIKCVLIDTAGRMHTEKNLLKEIEKISKVCKPDLKLFIGESITGNDAVEQAKAFNASIGIDGIVLTKADIDEKGGSALSVGYVTNKPILFLGTGQEYADIEPFSKKKFVEKLGL